MTNDCWEDTNTQWPICPLSLVAINNFCGSLAQKHLLYTARFKIKVKSPCQNKTWSKEN